MPDALGWRKKFGVLAPSTNTIVEPDFYRMGVPGVTSHFSRIHIRDQNLSDDAAFEALMVQIRDEIGSAVERVMTAEPDYMVMGMSSETFWGGVEGNRQFQQRIMDLSGLEVATGAEAANAPSTTSRPNVSASSLLTSPWATRTCAASSTSWASRWRRWSDSSAPPPCP